MRGLELTWWNHEGHFHEPNECLFPFLEKDGNHSKQNKNQSIRLAWNVQLRGRLRERCHSSLCRVPAQKISFLHQMFKNSWWMRAKQMNVLPFNIWNTLYVACSTCPLVRCLHNTDIGNSPGCTKLNLWNALYWYSNHNFGELIKGLLMKTN